MADLSHVAYATQKIAKIAAIGIAAIILLVVIFNLGVIIKNLVAPTPAAPPTVAFGTLQNVTFPQAAISTPYSYTINTLSGTLPQLPDRIAVYQLAQPLPNLLGLDKAKSLVAGIGFTDAPVALSETAYQWSKTDPFPTTITMDTQTFDFTVKSQYQSDPTVAAGTNMPSQEEAQTVSTDFFSKIIPLPTSIDVSKTKITLLAITPSGLTPATSLSSSQIIRVDYFPKSINTIPIYTANPDKSLIYTLVASGTTNFPQVVEAQYYHKNVSSSSATYPIKTAQQAYDDLKQGNGYIASNPTGNTNVTITNVTLGYYEDVISQKYLWPIIVFQGDKGFYAYVSAISDQWIK